MTLQRPGRLLFGHKEVFESNSGGANPMISLDRTPGRRSGEPAPASPIDALATFVAIESS
jgi:hypothetical protein